LFGGSRLKPSLRPRKRLSAICPLSARQASGDRKIRD
jgi:hypothetical protein